MSTEFKQKPLKSIEKKFSAASAALECLDVGKAQCFKAVVDSRRLVEWLRSTIACKHKTYSYLLSFLFVGSLRRFLMTNFYSLCHLDSSSSFRNSSSSSLKSNNLHSGQVFQPFCHYKAKKSLLQQLEASQLKRNLNVAALAKK